MRLSTDALRAVIFSGVGVKESYYGLLVRQDKKFLEFEKFKNVWRLTSGDFVGSGSIIDQLIVRTDKLGNPIPPKKWFFQRIINGNNGAACTWQEALGVASHFCDFGLMPPGLTWWKGVEPK